MPDWVVAGRIFSVITGCVVFFSLFIYALNRFCKYKWAKIVVLIYVALLIAGLLCLFIFAWLWEG